MFSGELTDVEINGVDIFSNFIIIEKVSSTIYNLGNNVFRTNDLLSVILTRRNTDMLIRFILQTNLRFLGLLFSLRCATTLYKCQSCAFQTKNIAPATKRSCFNHLDARN